MVGGRNDPPPGRGQFFLPQEKGEYDYLPVVGLYPVYLGHAEAVSYTHLDVYKRQLL